CVVVRDAVVPRARLGLGAVLPRLVGRFDAVVRCALVQRVAFVLLLEPLVLATDGDVASAQLHGSAPQALPGRRALSRPDAHVPEFPLPDRSGALARMERRSLARVHAALGPRLRALRGAVPAGGAADLGRAFVR